MRRYLIGASLLPILALLALTGTRSALPSRASAALVAVTTQHNDNDRSGLNLNETILNTSNVNAAQFGKLFTRAVDGRIFAQPLVVPNLSIPGQGTHNVVFVATMHNSVYAYDADDPTASTPLWHVLLDSAATTSQPNDGCNGNISPPGEVGIVSTPVIDLSTNTMYVVDHTKSTSIASAPPSCNPAAYQQYLHALDITTGQDKQPPVAIQASAPGTGPQAVNGTITFNPMQQLQRPALLLANGVIYIGFGSYNDQEPYDGWLLGYDAATLQQKYVWMPSPNPSSNGGHNYESGIWNSGQGPLADSAGNIYVSTGNGAWDAQSASSNGGDYGDSIVKLNPAAATGPYPQVLPVTDWFTPYNELYLDHYDLDIAVDGLVHIPGTDLLLTFGKDGYAYVVNRSNMGKWQAASNSQIAQNFLANLSHTHGSPICWQGPSALLCYDFGEVEHLKAWTVDPVAGKFQVNLDGQGFNLPTYETSYSVPYQGGFMSLSANGSTAGTGILWAISALQVGSCTGAGCTQGILRAFDATNLTPLWDSQQNAARDSLGLYSKFMPPTVANGKVYVPTFSNVLDVYGLLPQAGTSTPTPTNGPSATPSSTVTNTPIASSTATVNPNPPTSTATATPTSTGTSTATGTPTPLPASCPFAFNCQDIGGATPAGGQVLSSGAWTLSGGGTGIANAADQFHVVWQTLNGDGSVYARVVSQTNTDPGAQVGVMLRQSTDPASPFYAALVTPGNGVTVLYRAIQGGTVSTAASVSGTAPIWVKVTRTGNSFSAYTSGTGVTWTPIAGSSASFSANTSLLAALAVSSHTTSAASIVLLKAWSISAAPATATPTSTATSAPTSTAMATSTPTSPPANTATATNVPPTSTATSLPTSTATIVPSATSTATSLPSSTATATSVPPTSTATPISTPTSMPTSTPSSPATSTAVPPSTSTSTPTSTPTASSAGCPNGWTCADIGASLAGSQSLSGGAWTVQGAGQDIGNTADQFHFVWQSLAGDGSVVAQVTAQTNTSSYAKAGLMLRQSADPGSPMYGVYVTPGGGIFAVYRTAQGASAQRSSSVSYSLPAYVRVLRVGNTFSGYTSTDGTTWTLMPNSTATFSQSSTLLAGMAISSHNAGTLGSATYAGVAITTPSSNCPINWSCADIGGPSPLGSQTLANGAWTVQGSGIDIGSPQDQFHYVWQSLTGDGSVAAQVTSQTNTSTYAKAGVMLRGSTDPSAPFYSALVTPGGGVFVVYRATQGGTALHTASVAGAAPLYLKVVRAGSTFAGYTSTDGVTYTLVPGSSVTLNLASPVLAGLSVTSQASGSLSTATFNNVYVGP